MKVETAASAQTLGDPVAAAVYSAIQEKVSAAGLFLEDVVVKGAKNRRYVEIYLDLPEGTESLGSAQLEDVSREIGAELDTKDPIDGAYTLEISTLGAEHPLTNLRLMRRALGKDVEVRTTTETVEGQLSAVDQAGVDVIIAGDTARFAFEDIESLRTVILFGKPQGPKRHGKK